MLRNQQRPTTIQLMLRNQQSLATIPLSLVSNSVNIPRTVIFNPHRDHLRPRRKKEILGRIFLSAFIWNLGAAARWLKRAKRRRGRRSRGTEEREERKRVSRQRSRRKRRSQAPVVHRLRIGEERDPRRRNYSLERRATEGVAKCGWIAASIKITLRPVARRPLRIGLDVSISPPGNCPPMSLAELLLSHLIITIPLLRIATILVPSSSSPLGYHREKVGWKNRFVDQGMMGHVEW